MKKNALFILFALILLPLGLKAQTIQNGVLVSWPMATGDIKMPDEVVEIAPNCFFESGGGWGDDDDWEGYNNPGAFRSSNNEITSVDFNNVKKIGKEAFKECRGIKSVKMPHVEEIGEEAFASCDNQALKTLELPSIKVLGKNSFFSCSSLESVVLGGELKTIAKNPFSNCPNIKEFKITNPQAQYLVLSGAVLTKDKTTALILLPGYEKITLPSETTEVAEGAAQNVKTLKIITGKSVKVIGENSFASADALESVYLPKLESVGFFSFGQIGGIKLVDIHESENFTSFGSNNISGPSDIAALTIYVANETVKNALAKHYTRATIKIGAPEGELTKYTVNFSVNPVEAGFIEAWIAGPVNVNNGDQVGEGSLLKLECRYDFVNYEFSHWIVNGERLPGSEGKPQILEISSVDKDLTIVAHCNKLPEGNRIFFKSANTMAGTVTAVMDGKPFNSSDLVPNGKSVTFTATPQKGYEVTDWLFENSDGQYVADPALKGKTTWTVTPTKPLDFYVSFERMSGSVVVKYRELSGNGKLTAKMEDGTAIVDGEAIPRGKNLIFVAEPNPGYKVGTWIINTEEQTSTEKELRVNNVIADLEVFLVCRQDNHEDPDHQPVIEGNTLIKWDAVGEVVIPDNVKHIADFAFKGANLVGLTISAGVETIGELPFMFCGSLKKLSVDTNNKHFTSVDNAVYTKDGKELVQIATAYPKEVFTLPKSVEKVRMGAFTFAMPVKKIEGANDFFETIDGMLIRKVDKALIHYPSFIEPGQKVELIQLPDDIKKIEKYACAFNFFPQKLQLPQALEEVADYAFNGAANLVELKIDHCNNLKRIGDFSFKGCFKLASFELPGEGVTYIGEQALQGTAIVSLNVPKKVQIGANAFRGCQSLAQVFSYGMVPPILDDLAFSDIADIDVAVLHVPIGTKEVYAKAAGWKAFKNIVEEEDLSVEEIDTLAVKFSTQNGILTITTLTPSFITVYNMAGEAIKRMSIQEETSISLAHGQYVVVVVQGDKKEIRKVIL
ncbi:leucine-rich repeat domain-containing protein [Porphyromonas circumdentaria]|uniref:Leucine rich repeat-containing protein n=1 Tax=Porphyromonas circumdentaria TaxID=29524 RepID=A0A1T4L272_9PORP|nr:leucine-rich repeat domain-containing protein [Porphyromonas circumdentaria]MBB6275190.1 hypothetical protein [Porphyromonas circumdentaria]SJZ48698.1 Leucine rich repeat-containing protein [Porphyromonas circumdentaria]